MMDNLQTLSDLMADNETIKELKEIRFQLLQLRHGAGPTEPEFRNPINEIYDRMIKALGVAIKSVEENTWIPVTKALPEVRTKVLVLCNDGIHESYVDIAIVTSVNEHGPYWEEAHYEYEDIDDVIGWIPLPEAEMEEGEMK